MQIDASRTLRFQGFLENDTSVTSLAKMSLLRTTLGNNSLKGIGHMELKSEVSLALFVLREEKGVK